jgi:hypothetical protein
MGLNHSPQIVTNGLVLCLDAANIKSYKNYNLATYSQDFTNAVWNKSAGVITATGILASDGTMTATTLTDDDAGAYDNVSRSFTIPNDSSTYNISIYIRKTTGGTSPMTGFNINLTGGTLVNSFPRFNTDTGVLGGSNNMSVTSENNNFWRISFTVTNNSSGNTTLAISYYPATGPYNGSDINTATGSQTVWGFQVTRGATLLPYKTNVNDSADAWTDLSGNGLNATLLNGPAYNINNSGSIAFDATVGRLASLTYNSSNFRNTNFTWIAWVKGVGSPTVNMPQIGYGSGGWPRLGFFENSGTWYFQQYNISGPPTISTVSCGPSSTTSWKQICCVGNYTGSQIIGYNNGVFVTNAAYVDSNGNDVIFGIGRAGSTHTPWNEAFLGNISSVNIYNRALSATEIQQNFNALRGRFGI